MINFSINDFIFNILILFSIYLKVNWASKQKKSGDSFPISDPVNFNFQVHIMDDLWGIKLFALIFIASKLKQQFIKMPAIPRVDRIKDIYSSAKALNFAFRLSATNPIAPAFNGVSAYQSQLQRITIKFCKQSESSVGMRNYIENSLTKFATENPNCAIYVVPGRNATPVLRAEYANGRQVHVNAKNFSMERICLHMNNLRTRSGIPIFKFENSQFSHNKSVQGMWTPSKWRDSRQNLHILPKPEFSPYLTNAPTATKYVWENSVPPEEASNE